jgi:hypothetical protein
MSRTDKTNPFVVKLWDGTLRRVACHDHATGPCDLPGSLREYLAADLKTRCTWDVEFDGTHVCCCQLCRAQTWERAARKGERSRLYAGLGEELKAFRTDGEWND